MNYYRKLKGNLWAVQTDRSGLRSGDGIEVTMKDGTVRRAVVRRVVSRLPAGDVVTLCPDGTPEVRRPLENQHP